jgi:hypothetical protein
MTNRIIPGMGKIALVAVSILTVGVLLLVSPVLYLGIKNSNQRRALQNRNDFDQIANACVTLARSLTNEVAFIKPSDPIVPPLLRSLSPRYMNASPNGVTMEFHGGFDHYGYRVRQSATNPLEWTISWYTEKSARHLGTISRD